MSPSSRRPRRPPRGRNRPPQRVSTFVRSVVIVTAVWSIAIGTYFAYRLIGSQQIPYEELRVQVDRLNGQLLNLKQVEQRVTALQQRQATLEQRAPDLSATGTIKSERIAPPLATPAEKPTSSINDVVFAPPERIVPPEATPTDKPTPASPTIDTVTSVAPPEREARLQPPELPPKATTKHHQAHRAARQRASRRAPGATPAEQPSQVTSATTRPDAGIADQ